MPEVRLIDANASADKILRETEIHADEIGVGAIAIMIAFARALRDETDFPTIKSEPVRHGRMIEGTYPNENKCSECGKMFRDDIKFIIQDDDGAFHNPARCPECGCYWDGGADNG
jgi:DNA-directed RNA polymerase subunit RPC12/RpoP